MKYAIVNGEKIEAYKGESGICPSCNSELIAKCGEKKINHWAHKGNRNCDHWWENETEWHRCWKGQYPIEWQEVVQFDEKGEKHIADVKINDGLVLEFQHSYIKPEEVRSRNVFYSKLAWIVDGLRRIKDKPRFLKVVEEGSVINLNKLHIHCVEFPEESRILKEWVDCKTPVLFDFHEPERLWFLIPISSIEMAYIVRISRESFLETTRSNLFQGVSDAIIKAIHDYYKYINLKNKEATDREVNQIWFNSNRKKYRRRF